MAKDLMLDNDNILLIRNGDLVVEDSRFQHVKHLLEAEKGFYKFDPTFGVAITRLMNDELAPDELLRLVRLELERDGFKIEKLQLTNLAKLDIDGNYESE